MSEVPQYRFFGNFLKINLGINNLTWLYLTKLTLPWLMHKVYYKIAYFMPKMPRHGLWHVLNSPKKSIWIPIKLTGIELLFLMFLFSMLLLFFSMFPCFNVPVVPVFDVNSFPQSETDNKFIFFLGRMTLTTDYISLYIKLVFL